jgi:hypothetical protein
MREVEWLVGRRVVGRLEAQVGGLREKNLGSGVVGEN